MSQYIEYSHFRQRCAILYVLGMLIGGGAVQMWHWFPRAAPAVPSVLCDYPKHNGEGMFVAMIDGKYICWDVLR